jgi:hypothetical protein
MRSSLYKWGMIRRWYRLARIEAAPKWRSPGFAARR